MITRPDSCSSFSSQQAVLFAPNEIAVDLFAGGGGASVGLEMALGRPVDVAVNHNPIALAMHKVNHPLTDHKISDVWEVDPRIVARGRRVRTLWMSPDCRHFSRAKAGTPVNKKIRSLAWVGVDWAKKVAPNLIMLENVPEFLTWGPLMPATDASGSPRYHADGEPMMIPDPDRKGETFAKWKSALEDLGYVVEHRELRACDYGVPTIRQRLFVIARRDGMPIVWPEITHGAPQSLPVRAGHLKPYRTTAQIMDWSLPAHSIFLTQEIARERGLNIKRPLAQNTLRRIANGVRRFVLQAEDPFIVQVGPEGAQELAAVSIAKNYTGVVGHDVRKPLGTVTAVDHHSLVVSRLAKLPTDSVAPHVIPVCSRNVGHDARSPLGAVTTVSHASHLVKLYGSCEHGVDVREPCPAVTAGGNHLGEVRSELACAPLTDEQRYRAWWTARFIEDHTDGAKAAAGSMPQPRPTMLVVASRYALIDIGLRMLEPHELFRAQGFPASYVHDRDKHGKAFTKAAQIAACGNSVPPALPQLIAQANLAL